VIKEKYILFDPSSDGPSRRMVASSSRTFAKV